jgi:hypothetical protein
MRKIQVRIDLQSLQSGLSREDATSYTASDIRKWLQDAGFTDAGEGWWVVDERHLGQLNPTDVLEVRDDPNPGRS